MSPHKIEKTSGTIESLPHSVGPESGTCSRNIEVETSIEKLTQSTCLLKIVDDREVHRKVTTPSVVPKHCWRQIPPIVAVGRELAAVKASLERSRCENRAGCLDFRHLRMNAHATATSGGRYSASWSTACVRRASSTTATGKAGKIWVVIRLHTRPNFAAQWASESVARC